MGLAENRSAAAAAISHCKHKFTVGASTRVEDVHLAQLTGLNLHTAVDNQRNTYNNDTNQRWTDKVAQESERTGIGNCGEQAITAFEFLRWNYEKLDCAVLQSVRWNHSFAVIGNKSFTEGGIVRLNRNTPPTWPPDAVICDPWFTSIGRVVTVSNAQEWKTYVNGFLEVTRADKGNFNLFQQIWYGDDEDFKVLART
jgi:hypothetical protein